MSKSKIDIISDAALIQIISESTSYQDVLSKIGYKQTSDNRVIKRLKERCENSQISLSHLSKDKRCTICNVIKPITEFYLINDRPMSFCKDCQKEKERNRYKENAQRLTDFKKTLSCKKCGERRFYLFDFHHKDPSEKDFTISNNSRASLESLKEEISKCDVLCANCHREWHYLSRVNPSLSYEDWINNGEVAELVECGALLRR